jgi:putative ABC transport system substrate-binding protein
MPRSSSNTLSAPRLLMQSCAPVRAASLAALALLSILTASSPAQADEKQQAPIIVLSSPDVGTHRSIVEALRTTLGKQGLTIANPVADPGLALAASGSIAASGASPIVFSVGESSTRWVLQHTQQLPVVGCLVATNGAAPKAPNATGVVSGFKPKQELTLLRKILPSARRVGVLFSPAENGERIIEATDAARELGLELKPFPIDSPQQIPDALARALETSDVIWGIRDKVVLSPQTAQAFLVESFRKRVPLIGPSLEWVRAGALYAMDINHADVGQQCAEVALKVLRGAGPATIGLASPRTSTYALNLHTARHMNVEFSAATEQGAAFTITPKANATTGSEK